MGTYALRNVVLVHGGFVDGSGWQGVYESLSRDGFRVSIVQNPTLSLEGDVEATRRIIDAQDGPVVLVGHSYGGAVITQASAGMGNVKALVYLAAFGLDVGESCVSAQEPFPAPLLATENQPTPYDAVGSPGGPEVYVKKERFREVFCGDSSEEAAAVMYATQRPLAVASLTQNATAAGWKDIPSWFVVSDNDNAISPKAEEFYAERMKATTSHVDGSHTAFIPRHAEIAEVIRAAAES